MRNYFHLQVKSDEVNLLSDESFEVIKGSRRRSNRILTFTMTMNRGRSSRSSINSLYDPTGRRLSTPSKDIKGGLLTRPRLASSCRPPSKNHNQTIQMLVKNTRKAWSVSGNHYPERPRHPHRADPDFVDRDYKIISEMAPRRKGSGRVHAHCSMVLGPTHEDDPCRRSKSKTRRPSRESEKNWKLPEEVPLAITSQPKKAIPRSLTPKSLKPRTKKYKSKLLQLHYSNHAFVNYGITILVPGWSFGVLWDRFYPGKGLIFGLFFQCTLSFLIFLVLSLVDNGNWERFLTQLLHPRPDEHPSSENITAIAELYKLEFPESNFTLQAQARPKMAIDAENYVDLHRYEITESDVKTHIEIFLSAGIIIYLLFLVRLRVNEENRIKSNICQTCCVVNFCGYCYLIQAASEYDYELINCCDQVINVDECSDSE